MPMYRFAIMAISAFVIGIGGYAWPTDAASTVTTHGVRVHRLIEPSEQQPESVPVAITGHVAPHRHTIRLRKGERVVVIFEPGIGRSRYRKRHPGIRRPWSWQHSAGRRNFMNPPGLYSSRIYRPGFF